MGWRMRRVMAASSADVIVLPRTGCKARRCTASRLSHSAASAVARPCLCRVGRARAG